MELRTLRYFVAVVDEGSVTAASAVVRVAQPSLSRQLRTLERELGSVLFERGGGRLKLSAAGASLLPLAREVLVRADGLTAMANAVSSGQLTRIRIAAPPTTISDIIAPFIASFGPADPLPSVASAGAADLFELLDTGAADLVLSPRPPLQHLASRLIGEFPIWLYVRPQDPIVQRGRVPIGELDAERLLLLPRSFVQRELFEAAASSVTLSLEPAREVTSPEIAQALAAAGWGWAVVSDDSRFGLRGIRILTDEGELTMPVYGAWKHSHFAQPMVSDIVERLTEFCAARYGA